MILFVKSEEVLLVFLVLVAALDRVDDGVFFCKLPTPIIMSSEFMSQQGGVCVSVSKDD